MPARAPRRAAPPRLAALAALVIAVGLAACGADPEEPHGEGIQGEGEVVTEIRELEPFTRVSVAADMKVIIGEAAEQSVRVGAQQNLLEAIETEVRDGQLIVTLAEPVNPTQPMSLTIKVTEVESVALSAGSVGFIEHTGGGIYLDVSGRAELTAIGNTADLRVSATSGSHAKLAELVAQYAQVKANDGATVELNVVTSLTGSADGGSTVILSGNPATVEVATSSGATVQGG